MCLFLMPPFEEEKTYCFAHVCRSVTVTFSFPINNSRTSDLPFSNLVHISVLGSRGTLLILGSLGL